MDRSERGSVVQEKQKTVAELRATMPDLGALMMGGRPSRKPKPAEAPPVQQQPEPAAVEDELEAFLR